MTRDLNASFQIRMSDFIRNLLYMVCTCIL